MSKEKIRIVLTDEVAKAIDDYRLLRKEIDSVIVRLEAEHAGHLTCKAGCCSCCINFGMLPVEFVSILMENEGLKSREKLPGSDSCPHLIDDLCTLYPSRPVICRTHGLPLLYNDGEDWQLSVCELNFTGNDQPDFDMENCFPQDTFNSRLYMINRKFIEAIGHEAFQPDTLLELSALDPDRYRIITQD